MAGVASNDETGGYLLVNTPDVAEKIRREIAERSVLPVENSGTIDYAIANYRQAVARYNNALERYTRAEREWSDAQKQRDNATTNLYAMKDALACAVAKPREVERYPDRSGAR